MKTNLNKHASEMGKIGGKNRMKKLTKKQRQELSKKAHLARWGKKDLTKS